MGSVKRFGYTVLLAVLAMTDALCLLWVVTLSGSVHELLMQERGSAPLGLYFSRLAAESGAPLLYVNNVGIQNNGKTVYTFDGSNAAYDAHGVLRLSGEPYEEATQIFDLETLSAFAAARRSSGRSFARTRPSGSSSPENRRLTKAGRFSKITASTLRRTEVTAYSLHREPPAGARGREARGEYGSERHTEIPRDGRL